MKKSTESKIVAGVVTLVAIPCLTMVGLTLWALIKVLMS